MNARALLDRAEDAVFSILLPQTKCAVCSGGEHIGYGVCPNCLNDLHELLIGENCCALCGLPDCVGVCEVCDDSPPAFSRALGAYRYEGAARALVHLSKFGGQPRLAARSFAPAMVDCLRDIFPNVDCLVPVPLSRGKMLERGYNQSAFLAARIRALTGMPVRESILYRNRDTAQQAALEREERASNVSGAFTATRRAKGLRIALIDDVVTTSHTAAACAEALLDAGALEVCVVAATRAGGGGTGGRENEGERGSEETRRGPSATNFL